MINTNAVLASSSFGMIFAGVFTAVCTLIFIGVIICLWWVEIKKKPLRELGVRIRKSIWGCFEKFYEFFHTNTTVKTVYSDKSMNYSGTEFLPIPTKAPTNQYTYEFVGWDKNGVDDKGNMVVRAIYLQKVTKCYINVFDDDKITLLHSAVVEYGAGVNLSDLHPTKPDSKEFSYQFIGWDKDTNAFYKNENVYAVYNAIPKKYTYKFVQEDGETIVSQGTAIYGTPIISPKPPKKLIAGDDVYEFAGWKNYVEDMLLTKDCVFVAEFKTKPVGGLGTSSIIKTDGDKIKIVPETKLTPNEDSNHAEIQKSQTLSTINFDTENQTDYTTVREIKTGAGTVVRKSPGMFVERTTPLTDAEKFSAINKQEEPVTHDKEVHQKIQLMTVKRSAGVQNNGSKVIKLKPKPEEDPKEDELLKNMMINKIKIDKKDD